MNRLLPPTSLTAAFTRRRALLAGGCGAALAALPFAITGCGGGDSALDIPFVTRVFEGVVTDAGGNDLVVQLNLNVPSQYVDKPSGSFDAATITLTDRLAIPFATTQSFAANGSFSGKALTVNVPGATAPLATAYQGQFVEADTIVLTPQPASQPGSPPPLRLVRVDNSFRPALDASTWQGTDAQQRAWTIHFFTRPDGDTGNGTELLRGDDLLAGQANGTFTGFAAMRQLQITVTRGAAAPVTLTGVFGPSGTTPPNETTQSLATTLRFSDGSSLTRTSPLP